MKVNDFNSKVNLPKFCAKQGYTDYQFVKLPTFGWFAYNKDKSFVGNIFDLVKPDERSLLFAHITKEKRDYLDFDMVYTETAEKTLNKNYIDCQLWSAAFNFAKKELETYQVTHKGKKEKLKNILAEEGYGPLLGNNVGVVTRTLLERFNMLPWPKGELRGKLLVATYHTPKHISSLEYCFWDEPSNLSSLFVNDEKGWYGSLSYKHIVSSFVDLWTNPGCTWDYKCDYWTDDIYTLNSEVLGVGDYIRIWTEAKNTVFDGSPLNKIIASGKLDDLRHHIGQLSYNQLNEVEEITGQKLTTYWKKARETQINIGDKSFVRRDNGYYTYDKQGNLQQLTNFAIDVEKIIKRKNAFFRIGTLHIGEKSAPFEMPEKYFSSNHLFQKGLKEKCLAAGLGVPLIFPKFANRALLIVETFNAGTEIEVEQPLDV